MSGAYSDDEWFMDYTVEAHQVIGSLTVPPLMVWAVMGENNVPEDHWIEGIYHSEEAAELERLKLRAAAIDEGYDVYGESPEEELRGHSCEHGACPECDALRAFLSGMTPATREHLAEHDARLEREP